jgi:hypothetical protein
LGTVVSFAVEQASAQDAKRAPAKQEGTQAEASGYPTQFNPREYLKEDSRTEYVKVELAARAGDRWNVRQVQTRNGKFDLGVPPAGEYELRFSDADGHGDATANRGITISTSHVEYSDDDPKHNSDVGRLSLTLFGAVGGKLTQEIRALDSKVDPDVARAGKPKFRNITFRTDGKTPVQGVVHHEAAMQSIRNTR